MEILNALHKHTKQSPLSFHVPGHKNGHLFQNERVFQKIGKYDVTELNHMDDLYDPQEFLKEALDKTSNYYGTDHTYFLVNGSTVGNLISILATVKRGQKVFVQRNCHKSVFHGLELASAQPIILPVEICKETNIPIGIDIKKSKDIIKEHDGVAVILTYPNYYGHTVAIQEVIDEAHKQGMPVIVDEAHGAHFKLPFKNIPDSSINLGADLVVQSAHKTLPALTMGSFLHIRSDIVQPEKIEKYLHILQTSSPSYLIMASLDYAVDYLQSYSKIDEEEVFRGIQAIQKAIKSHKKLSIVSTAYKTDPYKVLVKGENISGYQLQKLFDKEGIYTELANENYVLFVLGLLEYSDFQETAKELERRLKNVEWENEKSEYHPMVLIDEFSSSIPYSYEELEEMEIVKSNLNDAVGKVSAAHIIPYPPGIPIPMKGEVIIQEHIDYVKSILENGGKIQGFTKEDDMEIVVYQNS